MKRVIVGVDGSRQSVAALRTAADEASCRGARLEAVYVYPPVHELTDYSTATGAATVASATASPLAVEGLRHNRERVSREAREYAEGRLRQYIENAELDPSDVDLTVVADAHPARVLKDVAVGADLLVIGSRGLGALTGRLLGSVSQQCVSHAPCSVLVVRSGHAGREQGAQASAAAQQP